MRKLTIFGTLLFACTLGIVPVFATGVQQDTTTTTAAAEADLGEWEPISEIGRHAQGFEAQRRGDHYLVTVNRPWQGADSGFTYLLYPKDEPAPADTDADLVIGIPVSRVITMSTTILPHLLALDELESLVGVDSLAWAYAPEVTGRGADGQITEIGSGPMVDVEKAIVLDPQVIMVNSYGGDWDSQPVLENAELPVVVSGDWVETDPLGPAEWLLFTSLFYDKLDEALEIYDGIVSEYTNLADLAATVTDKPSVLVNAPYQGSWAVSGGASYAANFISDAGGDYVWANDTSTGSLFFDIESVYAEAGEADVWINTGVWSSLAGAEAEDSRFASFTAFKNGQLFNSNKRVSDAGGNDYFESGSLNPQVILKDLIWVFHPELVGDYQPFYYQQLK